MAEPNNIDLFNENVSKTFALLYEAFPKPIGITPGVFGIPEDSFDRSWPAQFQDFEPIGHAIKWLALEGFIRYREEMDDGSFLYVQLTEKGLVTLRSVPKALQGTEPLGSQIKSAVKTGAVAVARKLAEEALNYGIKYGTGQ